VTDLSLWFCHYAEELKQYVENSLSVKDVPGSFDALFVPGILLFQALKYMVSIVLASL